MKAMILKQRGTSEEFQLAERPTPRLKPGHMVIAVSATSVNPLDLMLRSVETPWSDDLPEILHGDVAGTVVEVAEDVDTFNIGDQVYGMAGGIKGTNGALAEYMRVDARLMAKKPKTLSMKQAAALPLVAITAYEALVQKMNLGPADHILIHGATGGVGHIAVQLAKCLGAVVTATHSTKNTEVAKTLGADNLVDHQQTQVREYVQTLTAGKGFDKVFDTVAGDNIQRSFEAVKYNGHVATVLPIDKPLPIALKSLTFHSVLMLLPLYHGLNLESHGRILAQIADWVDEGKITPILDDTHYRIWDVAKAHDRLESGNAVGKVVLTL